MRDDLHKTVPLSTSWRKVLRCLSRERWSAEQLAPLIVGTVQGELARQEDAGARVVVRAINGGRVDLFDDGAEAVRLRLLQIQDGFLTPHVRATCEMALGVLATDGMSQNFEKQVMRAVGVEYAKAQVELIVSSVMMTHGPKEAGQVQRVLSVALGQCDFSRHVDVKRLSKKKSTDEMLSTELSINV
ncbi:hypothetical protein [Thauera sp.]|jgi:hypothetical protein|uniref:hypothetical protein n=1 Tax=Thauera sp. TaxID=1905334 RepID=UPI00257A8D30|nr:hypothetical protein [Thauera sp.]